MEKIEEFEIWKEKNNRDLELEIQQPLVTIGSLSELASFGHAWQIALLFGGMSSHLPSRLPAASTSSPVENELTKFALRANREQANREQASG